MFLLVKKEAATFFIAPLLVLSSPPSNDASKTVAKAAPNGADLLHGCCGWFTGLGLLLLHILLLDGSFYHLERYFRHCHLARYFEPAAGKINFRVISQ